MSAEYWAAAEKILGALRDGTARPGDVRTWLEATGTEPSSIIGLHVWDEPPERSRLQAEMHAMLVRHLEEKLNAGEVDPDRLVTGDDAARQVYTALQEQWMATPLPDGRVPMDALLDEQDAEFVVVEEPRSGLFGLGRRRAGFGRAGRLRSQLGQRNGAAVRAAGPDINGAGPLRGAVRVLPILRLRLGDGNRLFPGPSLRCVLATG